VGGLGGFKRHVKNAPLSRSHLVYDINFDFYWRTYMKEKKVLSNVGSAVNAIKFQRHLI